MTGDTTGGTQATPATPAPPATAVPSGMGRKTMVAIANMAVGTILGLVALKLAAQYFGPFYMGQVTYALGILGLLFFVTDLGMGPAHVKHVSEGRDPGDCFATFTVYKVVATLVFIALALGVIVVYAVLLGKPIESTTMPVFLVCLVYFVSKSMQEVAQSSFDARLETARSQLASLVDTVVRVVLTAVLAFVAAALLHGTGPFLASLDPTSPLVAWARANPGVLYALTFAVGAIAGTAVSLTMLLRSFERGRFRMDILRSYWTFALPLFIGNAVWLVSLNIDAIALGFFGGEEDAGIFGAVRRVPQVLQGISMAVGLLLFPAISAMAARDDHAGISDTMDRALRYLSMLLLPILVFCILFAEPIIRLLLSNEYIPGILTLQLLCLYTLLASLALPFNQLLFGLRHQAVAAKVGVASALTVIVLDILLIPDDILGVPLADLGLNGAAIATLAAGLVNYVGLRWYASRLAGYRQQAHFLKHLLACLGMGLALWTMDAFLLPLERWYHFGLYALAGFGIYLGLLTLLREFTKRDLQYVVDATHPGEMLRYTWREITHRRR